MAYLDPSGLFFGDRLSRLSLEARLYWPYYYAYANDCGWFELNYRKMVNQIFATFPTIPSEPQVMAHLGEYHEQFLLFVFEANGQLWGQWDTPEKFLPRYKTKASQSSPSPGPAFIQRQDEYATLKSERLRAKPFVSSVFKNISQCSENLRKVPHDIGDGVVVDKDTAADSVAGRGRHSPSSGSALLAADGLPLTLTAARTHFPGVNGTFLTRLAQSVVSAGIEARDEQIAEALRETYRADQRTPNLWLSTAIEYLAKPDIDEFDPQERNRQILAADERASAEWRERLAREQEAENGAA